MPKDRIQQWLQLVLYVSLNIATPQDTNRNRIGTCQLSKNDKWRCNWAAQMRFPRRGSWSCIHGLLSYQRSSWDSHGQPPFDSTRPPGPNDKATQLMTSVVPPQLSNCQAVWKNSGMKSQTRIHSRTVPTTSAWKLKAKYQVPFLTQCQEI